MESKAGKFLTFKLGNEDYGITINSVKEIIGMMEITSIPRTPIFVKGVVNLRGKIIPVIDLRLKFSLTEIEYNQRTCIIVVEISSGESKRTIGIIVDAVSEVVNIQVGEIEDPPDYGIKESNNFLIGMGKVKGKVILLLEIDQVLTNEDMVVLQEMNRGNSNA